MDSDAIVELRLAFQKEISEAVRSLIGNTARLARLQSRFDHQLDDLVRTIKGLDGDQRKDDLVERVEQRKSEMDRSFSALLAAVKELSRIR